MPDYRDEYIPHDDPRASEGRSLIEEMYSLTDTSPLDLNGKQKDRIRAYFDASSFAFNWFIFGHCDMNSTIHAEMCAIIDCWGWAKTKSGEWTRDPGDEPVANDYRRLMIQVPRESFKTSLGTKAGALHQITKRPDHPVVIYNERLDNTKKWLRAIRETIENSLLFQVVYRDLLPRGIYPGDNRSMPRSWPWSDEKLQLERNVIGIPETSITAMGVGAASAGGHWPVLIFDDLISEDAVRSPSVMAHVKEWWDNAGYLERPALKGMTLVNCTCWAYEDLYDYILKNYDYTLYRRSALEDADGRPSITGDSIFPEKLSTQELRKQYHRNPSQFLTQMMNLPLASGGLKFPAAWNRTFDVVDRYGKPAVCVRDSFYDPDAAEVEGAPQEVMLEHMALAVLFDPATARKSLSQTRPHAKNGIVAVGICPWGRRFFFEALSFRKMPYPTLIIIIEMAQRWGIEMMGIEEVTFSEVYRYWIEDILEKEKAYAEFAKTAYCVPLETGGVAKALRIDAMQSPYQQGWYYFNSVGCGPLLEEFSTYPNGMTCDVVDSAAYVEKYLDRPETPTEAENRYWARKRATVIDDRDPITGY